MLRIYIHETVCLNTEVHVQQEQLQTVGCTVDTLPVQQNEVQQIPGHVLITESDEGLPICRFTKTNTPNLTGSSCRTVLLVNSFAAM